MDRKPGQRLLRVCKGTWISARTGDFFQRASCTASNEKIGLFDYFDGAVYGHMVSQEAGSGDLSEGLCIHSCFTGICHCSGRWRHRGTFRSDKRVMRPVMIPVLVEPDEEILKLVWHRFDTLYDVIDLLESKFQNS